MTKYWTLQWLLVYIHRLCFSRVALAWKLLAGGCDWSDSGVRPHQKRLFCAVLLSKPLFFLRSFSCAEASFGSNTVERRWGMLQKVSERF